MFARPSILDAMGLPAYLLDEHLEFDHEHDNPSGRPSIGGRDASAEFALHPLLDSSTVKRLHSLLRRDDEPSDIFDLNTEHVDSCVHVIVEGRVRLVAIPHNGPPFEIGQCGPGQWLGIPNALRAFDEKNTATRWSSPAGMHILAEPLGKVRTRWMLVSELIEALSDYATLRCYVRQIVANRFARRHELLEGVQRNPILRRLPPAYQEYLLQIGAFRRDTRMTPKFRYLAAGTSPKCVALLLAGESTVYLPGESAQFVGKFNRFDLLGLDAILTRGEVGHDSSTDMVAIPRTTDIYLGRNSIAFEFQWDALCTVLEQCVSTPLRLIQRHKTIRKGYPMPEIVCIQAEKAELGTSTLTQGAATALANMIDGKVCIVDLGGLDRFRGYYELRGFQMVTQEIPRRAAASGAQARVHNANVVQYGTLLPTELSERFFSWSTKVETVWPMNPHSASDAELLVELMTTRDDLRYIIVCVGHCDQDSASVARELAKRLYSRSTTVFHVTDDATFANPCGNVLPRRLVWIERMTPEYIARKQLGSHERISDALSGDAAPSLISSLFRASTHKPPQLPPKPVYDDHAALRQVVRVPDDADGVRLHDERGPCALVGSHAPNVALARAFARIARVITRRTIGLALGGGGAWAYSHVALIQNLEEQGVPIDYIAGSSFGATVGGLYAAGGLRALERLIEDNSLDADSPTSALVAPLASPLTRTTLLAPISTAAIEWFVNSLLRNMGLNGGQPIHLATTEIPFYPIGSNLTTQREFTEQDTTVASG